ncbi:hypothetical protein BsIDN1_39490 [Bacillus safensis]|uniref:Chorismate-utilising enzyme C-terminal domain-containing protein n=1 Tax=Bacillus safensis TaxID=561879 RepID=A0A5S9MBQ2_BACIA|nr:hypothetical protein BsIDN1_39490 [Bacillus safensis]
MSVSSFELYRVLRIVNPSPYMYFMKLKDRDLVGSSPERLIHAKNGHLEIHPIAGTRKRGRTIEEDAELAKELLEDEKEKSRALHVSGSCQKRCWPCGRIRQCIRTYLYKK